MTEKKSHPDITDVNPPAPSHMDSQPSINQHKNAFRKVADEIREINRDIRFFGKHDELADRAKEGEDRLPDLRIMLAEEYRLFTESGGNPNELSETFEELEDCGITPESVVENVEMFKRLEEK